jgi:methionyl-tRNA synthetase
MVLEDDKGIHISGVGGDVIGVDVSGSGNFIGKGINVDISGTVSINSQILNKLPEEYSTAFKQFIEKINEQIKKNNLNQQQVQPIQESITELAKESEGMTPDKEPSILKKQSWKEKFFKVLKNVIPALPKTAETIAAFTPLSPFSKIIGEGVQKLVEGLQKEM